MGIKRKLSGSTLDLSFFSSSASVFGEREERSLNIDIKTTDSFKYIIDYSIDNVIVPESLEAFILADFDRDKIRTYSPVKYPNLDKRASLFLYKLRLVIENNYAPREVARFEDYIHELVVDLFKEAKLEDGIDLIMLPSDLTLWIGDESFAARADREGRRGTEIVWILDENKHRFDTRYKQGDIQLAACMIAASQTNRARLGFINPKKIIGTKVLGDKMYFYSMEVTTKYLNQLSSGLPTENVIMYKFPKTKDLSLSNPLDRKQIFICLEKLRRYALSLEPIYTD